MAFIGPAPRLGCARIARFFDHLPRNLHAPTKLDSIGYRYAGLSTAHPCTDGLRRGLSGLHFKRLLRRDHGAAWCRDTIAECVAIWSRRSSCRHIHNRGGRVAVERKRTKRCHCRSIRPNHLLIYRLYRVTTADSDSRNSRTIAHSIVRNVCRFAQRGPEHNRIFRCTGCGNSGIDCGRRKNGLSIDRFSLVIVLRHYFTAPVRAICLS